MPRVRFSELSLTRIVQVFMALPSLKGNKIQADMVPGNFANIGGVSYWAPDPGETRKVVERLFIAPPQPPQEEKK